METSLPTPSHGADEFWVPLTKLAKPLGCSTIALHSWGKKGEFGYRRLGPKLFVVCVPEVLSFYTSKYPNIEINHEELDAVLQPTA